MIGWIQHFSTFALWDLNVLPIFENLPKCLLLIWETYAIASPVWTLLVLLSVLATQFRCKIASKTRWRTLVQVARTFVIRHQLCATKIPVCGHGRTGRGGGGGASPPRLLGKQSQSGNIRSTVGQYWLSIKKNGTNSVNFVENFVMSGKLVWCFEKFWYVRKIFGPLKWYTDRNFFGDGEGGGGRQNKSSPEKFFYNSRAKSGKVGQICFRPPNFFLPVRPCVRGKYSGIFSCREQKNIKHVWYFLSFVIKIPSARQTAHRNFSEQRSAHAWYSPKQ